MEMNGIPLHSWILYIIEAMVTKGQFAGFFFYFFLYIIGLKRLSLLFILYHSNKACKRNFILIN